MSHLLMTCTHCHSPLPASQAQATDFAACRNCGTQQWSMAFPVALASAAPVNLGTPLQSDEEASCFYHADKRADVPCDACGRFLCGLCAISFRGRTLCTNCLDAGLNSGALGDTRSTYPAYDSMAFLLATIPMLVVPIVVFTSPIAFYFSIRALRSPQVPARPGKLRAGIAFAIAGAEVLTIAYLALALALQILDSGI